MDDEKLQYQILNHALDKDMYEVNWYKSGEEFYANIDMPSEIMVLDNYLPDTNGVDLLRFLQEKYPSVNVIFFSGLENKEMIEEVYRLGAKEYIIKNTNAIYEFKNAIARLSEKVLSERN